MIILSIVFYFIFANLLTKTLALYKVIILNVLSIKLVEFLYLSGAFNVLSNSNLLSGVTLSIAVLLVLFAYLRLIKSFISMIKEKKDTAPWAA